MKLPPELPIPPEDREQTPLSVQAVVVMLWEEIQVLKAQVAQLQKQMGKLESEVARLQERVNKTSQNSSKPPSSDPRSFGTQSKSGSVFVERILTAVMTLRQQKRNVLDYLTAAC